MRPPAEATYIEVITAERVGTFAQRGGGYDHYVEWGCAGIGIPDMEYTVKPGDRITFYWRNRAGFGTPYGIRINDGPYIPYPEPR